MRYQYLASRGYSENDSSVFSLIVPFLFHYDSYTFSWKKCCTQSESNQKEETRIDLRQTVRKSRLSVEISERLRSVQRSVSLTATRRAVPS